MRQFRGKEPEERAESPAPSPSPYDDLFSLFFSPQLHGMFLKEE